MSNNDDVVNVSYRTQVLFCILEFQEEFGHGIKFNQLVDRSGLERTIVSKSHDSLSDMGLIKDSWQMRNELWSKEIEIGSCSLDFVRKMRKEIEVKINATN